MYKAQQKTLMTTFIPIALLLTISLPNISCLHPIMAPLSTSHPSGISLEVISNDDSRMAYFIDSRDDLIIIANLLKSSIQIDTTVVKYMYNMQLANGHGQFSKVKILGDIIEMDNSPEHPKMYKLPNQNLTSFLEKKTEFYRNQDAHNLNILIEKLKGGYVIGVCGLSWYLKDNTNIFFHSVITDNQGKNIPLETLLSLAPNKKQIRITEQ